MHDNPTRQHREQQKPVVVLISGNGSNLQALLDASQQEQASFYIAAVISNRADAYGLTRAKNAGVHTYIIKHQEFSGRELFDQEMIKTIDYYQPVLVILAGFMRILSHLFVQHYTGRLINIHPSLLPNYKGTETHQRVLEAGENEHGCSVHFVTEELDGGPVIMQAKTKIAPDDTVESLRKKIQALEHRVYPLVIDWFTKGRLLIKESDITLDGKILNQAIVYKESDRP